ncbi:MAG: hypothetical protein JXA11_10960 [Phycisphaerae bacterium]|nr:hypothetical protein [Phycisphaerae bacterium]
MLFEDPMWLMVILAVAELVVFWIWLQRRTKRAAWALLVPPIIAGMLLGLALVVVTDREKIQRSLQQIADDYQAERLDAAAKYLDDAYDGFGGDKESLLALAKQTRGKHPIQSIRVTRLIVHTHGRRAETEITTVVKLKDDLGGGAYGFAWTIDWVRRDAGWRILHINPPQTVVPGFEPGK